MDIKIAVYLPYFVLVLGLIGIAGFLKLQAAKLVSKKKV